MDTTTTAPAGLMQLQPYIYFYGRCREALDFYKRVFGGNYDVMYVKDTPVAAHMPAESQDKVMHASFSAPGVAFLCSDGRQTKAIDPEAGNISIALAVTDGTKGERIVEALSAGGAVSMPLDVAFWGGRFTAFVDRFGIEWMVTLP